MIMRKFFAGTLIVFAAVIAGFFIALYAPPSAAGDVEQIVGNLIKIGPVDPECLALIESEAGFQTPEDYDCMFEVSTRMTSLISGIVSCARSRPYNQLSHVCPTIASQLRDIQKPYNTMMARITRNPANGFSIEGEALDEEINYWLQAGTADDGSFYTYKTPRPPSGH